MISRLHVRPILRFAYAVDGRPAVLTKAAAYRGSMLAAVAKRCDCYEGTGAPDDQSEMCEYHSALQSQRYDVEPVGAKRQAAMERLIAIHKAEDAKTLASLDRPPLDLSHMHEDDLHAILVAVDWHLQHGAHRPARKRR